MVDRLATTCGPLALANPVLAASGTFGYGDSFERFWPLSTLGGFVTKTLFVAPRDGNPAPRVAETSAGMLNSIGLANVGWEAFVRDKAPRVDALRGDARLIVNIAGNSPEEFGEIAARVEADRDAVRCDAIEVNVSCPNVKEGGTNIGCHPGQFRDAVARVRAATTLPVFVKLSPNVADIVPFARAAAEEGADGVSVITPYFIRPTQAELADHFRRIAEATALSVVLYSNPGPCAGLAIEVFTPPRAWLFNRFGVGARIDVGGSLHRLVIGGDCKCRVTAERGEVAMMLMLGW